MARDMKPWKCKCGCVLGYAQRTGSGIQHLYLLRDAMDPADVSEETADVAGVVEGFMPSWRCSKCGRVRTWVPGREAMEQLVERVLRAYY